MKTITPPNVDDAEELLLLANNQQLGSYPNLLAQRAQFLNQYQNYLNSNGNPWSIDNLNIGADFRKALIRHYEKPPVGRLEFIKEYRRHLSPTLCPMCGGFGNGTLDHYLPKDDYPEYSFFSKNLVPACNCNSLRGTTVNGAIAPARVIHPYFDNFLNDRLYQSKFQGSFDTPNITIEVIDDQHPEVDILQFHLDEVISNDATQGWFEKYWSDLSQRPDDKLGLVLPEQLQDVTSDELMLGITKYRNAQDREHGTPNNWFSIFYTGLMRDQTRVERLAEIIRAR